MTFTKQSAAGNGCQAWPGGRAGAGCCALPAALSSSVTLLGVHINYSGCVLIMRMCPAGLWESAAFVKLCSFRGKERLLHRCLKYR